MGLIFSNNYLKTMSYKDYKFNVLHFQCVSLEIIR